MTIQFNGYDPYAYHGPISMPAAVSTASPDVAAMSPDALMLYCQSRVGSLDTQMNGIFQQQQQNNVEQGIAAQAATALQAYQTDGIKGDKTACKTLYEGLYAAYDRAKALDPNSSLTQGLAKLCDEVMASGSGPFKDGGVDYGYLGPSPHGYATGHTEEDNTIDPDEIAGYVSQAQGISSSINSSSELSMINLQSLMSQRQTAIQLTTNLVQSLNDADQKVVGNIGH